MGWKKRLTDPIDWFKEVFGNAIWEFIRSPVTVIALVVAVASLAWAWLSSNWAVVVAAFVAFLTGVLMTWWWLRRRNTKVARSSPTLVCAYEDSIKFAQQIATQNAERPPHKSILSLQLSYLIQADYSGAVIHDITLKAEEPLHFWELKVSVESAAKPVQYLEGIDLRFECSKGTIVYFLCGSGTHSKRMLLFFLPFLQPGEERNIKILRFWPGMFASLLPPDQPNPWNPTVKPRGFEPYTWSFRGSREEIPEVELAFYAHPDIGHLSAEITGAVAHGQKLQSNVPCPNRLPLWGGVTKNWRGLIYTIPHIQPHETRQFALRLEAKPPDLRPTP